MTTRMRLTIAATASAIAAHVAAVGSARADQCAWLEDPAVAARAAAELSRGATMIQFCEPCGDVAPGSPVAIAEVAVRPAGHGLSEVAVNRQGIDLAYTYVQRSDLEYDNLAALAHCHATGVSPSLRVDRATATGIIIRARRNAPPAVPAPRPALRDAAQVVEPLPDLPNGWRALFIAGLATVVMSSLLIGRRAVLARRRRASLPRAVHLIDRHPGDLAGPHQESRSHSASRTRRRRRSHNAPRGRRARRSVGWSRTSRPFQTGVQGVR